VSRKFYFHWNLKPPKFFPAVGVVDICAAEFFSSEQSRNALHVTCLLLHFYACLLESTYACYANHVRRLPKRCSPEKKLLRTC